MGAQEDRDGTPAEFVRAVDSLRGASLRPEVACEPMPAPQRIAPHAYAMTGDVTVRGQDLGSGRIVLLYDPAGNDAWHGTYRIVTFARADVDTEMGADPLLPAVGWSWLTDALAAHGAEYTAESGSVTTVRSEGFGTMSEDGSSAQLEIRASWTPLDAETVGAHASAWSDVLCTVAGLPPLAPGVVPMPSRRDGLDRRNRR